MNRISGANQGGLEKCPNLFTKLFSSSCQISLHDDNVKMVGKKNQQIYSLHFTSLHQIFCNFSHNETLNNFEIGKFEKLGDKLEKSANRFSLFKIVAFFQFPL